MKFFLVTTEYDSMAGSFQSPIEDVIYLLKANDFDTACVEAIAMFAKMSKYTNYCGDVFPQRPRVMTDVLYDQA